MRKNKISLFFNVAAKSKTFLQAGVLAMSAGVAIAPGMVAAADIDHLNTDNASDVTEFVQNEARSFLQSYTPQLPSSLQQYQSCEAPDQTTLTFVTQQKPTQYDTTSKSIADLTDNYNTGFATMGITTHRDDVEVLTSVKADFSIERVCLSISDIHIQHTVTQYVDIASDLNLYACYRERAQEHENQHVVFNRENTLAYRKIAEDFYRAALAPVNGVQVPPNANEYRNIVAQLREHVNRSMYDINNARIATAKKLHRKIDTLASYQQIAEDNMAACGYSLIPILQPW